MFLSLAKKEFLFVLLFSFSLQAAVAQQPTYSMYRSGWIDFNKNNKKDPCIGEHLHDGSGQFLRPTFQGHDLKQGECSRPQVAKPLGEIMAEDIGGND